MSLQLAPETLINQAESARSALTTLVARIPRDEWEWAPDEGIPGAAAVITALLDDEWKRAQRLFAGARESLRPIARPVRETATPTQATASMRAVRDATVALIRGLSAADAHGAETVAALAGLIAADARALGEISLLQRLIDPARTG